MRAYAKKTFIYNDEELEPGQVFEMIGGRNDEKLLSFGHAVRVEKRAEVLDCMCGRSFVGEGNLRVHQMGDKHPKEPLEISDEEPELVMA
ncbi:MAG: hypothetical protein ACFFD4_07665 [Candidatus Odinarchaeota archaeon]